MPKRVDGRFRHGRFGLGQFGLGCSGLECFGQHELTKQYKIFYSNFYEQILYKINLSKTSTLDKKPVQNVLGQNVLGRNVLVRNIRVKTSYIRQRGAEWL